VRIMVSSVMLGSIYSVRSALTFKYGKRTCASAAGGGS
jgi:hypothetical protein